MATDKFLESGLVGRYKLLLPAQPVQELVREQVERSWLDYVAICLRRERLGQTLQHLAYLVCGLVRVWLEHVYWASLHLRELHNSAPYTPRADVRLKLLDLVRLWNEAALGFLENEVDVEHKPFHFLENRRRNIQRGPWNVHQALGAVD